MTNMLVTKEPMTRELQLRMREKYDKELSLQTIRQVLTEFSDYVLESVSEGNDVRVEKIGTFKRVFQPGFERPNTLPNYPAATVKMTDRYVPRFKAATALKDECKYKSLEEVDLAKTA